MWPGVWTTVTVAIPVARGWKLASGEDTRQVGRVTGKGFDRVVFGPGSGVLLVLLAWLAGCAPIQHEMILGTERLKPEQRPVWPSLPETPRYEYLGQLLGVRNFRISGDESLRTTRSALYWLAGIDDETGFEPERNLDLQRPVSGCVDREGRILVSDMGHAALFVFNPRTGEFDIWRQAMAGQPFLAPVGVTEGGRGEYFVADPELRLVVRLDAAGQPAGVIGRGELERPTGVAWNPEQRLLYVADSALDQVKVFDRDGVLRHTIGKPGDQDGEFNTPTHVAYARNQLVVADTLNARIQIFDAEGRFVRTLGKRGNLIGDLARPKGVAVDGEGNLYVVESFHDHLLIFNREGQFLMPIGGTGQGLGEFYLPNGVWVDLAGRVFVADMFNGRVIILQFLGGDG
ncbi:MAG: 6-bladed beta-propeller [Magnetococcales bacterium]|nr:6-bladed beta-propeller [Magnetococcales bacterium]